MNETPQLSRTTSQQAERRVASFRKRFGEAHFLFACHAAFPLALTPDLAYHLWKNFQQDIHQRSLGISWIAVADVLLSSLCTEVGYELYEMNALVRNVLLKHLKASPDFGPQRLHELADCLLLYIQHHLNSDDLDTRDLAQAQYWTALAYVNPGQAAQSLALALRASLQDRPELLRMAQVIDTLAEPLSEFQPLLIYARGAGYVARDDGQRASEQFERFDKARPGVRVGDVVLPLPQRKIEQKAEPVQPSKTKDRSEERGPLYRRFLTYREDPKVISFVQCFCRKPRDQKRIFDRVEVSLKHYPGVPSASDERMDADLYRLVLDECFSLFYEYREQYIATLQSRYNLRIDAAEDLYADACVRLYRFLAERPYSISSMQNLFYNITYNRYINDMRIRQPLYQSQHMPLDDEDIAEITAEIEDSYVTSNEEQLLSTDKVEKLLDRIPEVEGGDERKQWLLHLWLLEDRTYREIAALDAIARELVEEGGISEKQARVAVMRQDEAIRKHVKLVESTVKDGAMRLTLNRARVQVLLAYSATELHEELQQHPNLSRRMNNLIEKLSASTWKTSEDVVMANMFVRQGMKLEDIVARMSRQFPSLSSDEWRSRLQKCLRQLFEAFLQGK